MKKIAAVVIMALALTGCFKPETDEAVIIMGDSLSMQFVTFLSAKIMLSNNAPLIINNTIGGMPTAWNGGGAYWAGRINVVRGITNVKSIAIALGTNDGTLYTAYGGDLYGEFPAAVDAIMQASTGIDVYWVVPSIESRMSFRDDIRGMLYDAASVYDNLHILEIAEGGLSPDEIHLSQEGIEDVNRKLYAAMGFDT